jgi:glycosyltransferase involved in cell wall biosynthesis
MKISVITVCWNAGKTIRYTVESFLAQTHVDKEMIIVDGASTDVTLDIVRSYRSPLIKIYSEKDKGIYDAMNKGLSLYTGDAVGFLNADDVYSSDKSLALSTPAARLTACGGPRLLRRAFLKMVGRCHILPLMLNVPFMTRLEISMSVTVLPVIMTG